MIRKLLDAFGKELCFFLAETLPGVETDWWNRCVVARLTFQQQNFVRFSGTTTLAGLDVAALMRVLDQNWHEIAPLNPAIHTAIAAVGVGERVRLVGLRLRSDGPLVSSQRTVLARVRDLPVIEVTMAAPRLGS